jgi:hypothetical protein
MSQTHNEHNLQLSPGTPRWVKVFGIIVLVLVLLVGVMLLSGGEHSPERHSPSADVTESHMPPVDHQGQHP